jgi:predicted MFS family arabinose efflux permease
VSALGDGMVLVGFPLLALKFTDNPALIAGVAVAGEILGPIVALPIGALADRSSPRRMLVTVQLMQFVLLGSFALCVAVDADSLALIYVAACLIGALTVAFDCASAAVVPRLVRTSQLVKANARLDIVDLTGEDMVGRALGGVTFAFAEVVPFFADAVTFLVSALVIRKAVPDQASAGSNNALMADLRAGTRWFLHNPLVRLIGGLIAWLAFCQSVVLALMVLYATQDLHLTTSGYGLLLGVTAIGSIVGALAAHRVHMELGSGWCIILGGAVAAVTYPLLAATSSAAVASIALILEAVAIVVGNVAAQSLRQSIVPTEMQGRVGSAHMMLVLAAAPLGALAGGLVADAIGIRQTFLAAGLLQLAVVAVAAPRLLSRIRALHYQTEATETTPATAS